MANPWFKFYAADYLKEVKFKGVDANKRSCFLTLLCYAADEGGKVDTRYLTEDVLMIESGVPMGGDAWKSTEGFYQWLVERGMGTLTGHIFELTTWDKRQESFLTGAERVKKHREAKNEGDVTPSVTDVTLEKSREDKKRTEKSTASMSFLSKIPETDLKELYEKYEASTTQIKRKADDLRNYCLSKGKTYKNYRAFLENALQKDFGRRLPSSPVLKVDVTPLSAEALARMDAIKAEVKAGFKERAVTHTD